jgi:hypothetical protein
MRVLSLIPETSASANSAIPAARLLFMSASEIIWPARLKVKITGQKSLAKISRLVLVFKIYPDGAHAALNENRLITFAENRTALEILAVNGNGTQSFLHADFVILR